MSEQSSGPFKNQDWGLRFRDKWACKVTMDCIQANKTSIAATLGPLLSGAVSSVSGKSNQLVVDDADPNNISISIIEVT
jgi:hypothetical protein